MEAGLSKESLGEEVHSYSDGCLNMKYEYETMLLL